MHFPNWRKFLITVLQPTTWLASESPLQVKKPITKEKVTKNVNLKCQNMQSEKYWFLDSSRSAKRSKWNEASFFHLFFVHKNIKDQSYKTEWVDYIVVCLCSAVNHGLYSRTFEESCWELNRGCFPAMQNHSTLTQYNPLELLFDFLFLQQDQSLWTRRQGWTATNFRQKDLNGAYGFLFEFLSYKLFSCRNEFEPHCPVFHRSNSHYWK